MRIMRGGRGVLSGDRVRVMGEGIAEGVIG